MIVTFVEILQSLSMAKIDGIAPASRGAATILIVDDEEIVLRTARASLERAGFTVLTANSGENAINVLISDTAISLVVLDMSMPAMNGKDVLQRILALGMKVPVLICSGHRESEIRHELSGLPIAGFAQKPFTSRQIAAHVSEALTGTD
jgi:DNA-binding NtrC family response regulator